MLNVDFTDRHSALGLDILSSLPSGNLGFKYSLDVLVVLLPINFDDDEFERVVDQVILGGGPFLVCLW